MTTRLFIENREIELDENVQFAITKQFEDLSNPTAIINDWSKTVSIPFTARNNAIFGYIYNPDKLTVEGGSNQALTGIYFNPYKKLDMRLQWGDDVLMVGYAKMNEVKQNNGKGTYEITLFGELGKVFQEMKKITFDTTTDDTDYLIHGEDYVEEFINKDLVYKSWTSLRQPNTDLKKKTDSDYSVTDIIGFAPSNAYKEGFDFTAFQIENDGDGESLTFQEALEKGFEGFPTFEEVTGISPSTIIPNGISPRGIGEYRSYLQLPFIYWNKLFQIFQAKAEEVTGYKFILDSNWFNRNNPYWYNLVYMLKQFDIKDGGTNSNTYKSTGKHPYADTIPPNTNTTVDEPYLFESAAFAYKYNWDGSKSQWTTERNIPITRKHYIKNESIPLVQDNMRLILSPNERVVTQAFSINGELELYYGLAIQGLGYNADVHKGFYYSPDVVTCVNLKYTGANGTVRRQIGAILQANANQKCIDYANDNAEAKYFIPKNCNRMNYIPGSTTSYRGSGCVWEFNLNFPETNLFYNEFGDYVDISIETNCWFPDGVDATMPYGRQKYMDESSGLYAMPPEWSNKYKFATIMDFNSELRITTDVFRSGSRFTLNDIWNKEVSVFDEILRYCKMFRIGINIDEVNKQLIFTPIDRYFENYTVTDWTNKIDKSKDFTITPITFEDKYILFNYEDGETKNNKVYKENYGYNYGEYRLTTDYNFNNKTNKLFEGQKPSNIISPIVLTWDTLYRENKIIYRIPINESYVDDGDNDNKIVDTFGQFYFHNGLKYFTKTDMPPVDITDDTKLMTWNQTYFYAAGYYETDASIRSNDVSIRSNTYPNLSLFSGDNMITFAIPKVCYVANESYSSKKGIYSNFWENYLNERYNIQNKIITCYVMLTPTEYNQFKWNKFVKIDNQLCIVNKIYDYDMTSNQPTKVDLITIQDINGYTKNNYNT